MPAPLRPAGAASWRFLTLCAGLLATREARAFNYLEHRAMALRGAAWVRAHGDGARLDAFVAALHGSLRPPSRACRALDEFAGRVDSPSPRRCFDVGDVPALAGDHSSSPGALRRRWLDGAADGDPSTVVNYLRGTWEASEVADSPVECHDESAAADAARLFEAQRDRSRVTVAVAAADAAYLCLAAHNAHHFRLVGLDPVVAAAEPLPNAFSAYAFYHLNALAEAARGGREAEALLLELYALHFLEDAIAGGHVAADRLMLNPGSAQRVHGRYNLDGVRMDADEALRRRADEVLDTGWAREADGRELFYGDDQVAEALDGARCDGTHRARCRTLAAGAALVALSLEEFVAPADASRRGRCGEAGAPVCGSPESIQIALGAGGLAAVRHAPRVAQWTRTLAAPTFGRLARLRILGGATWRADSNTFAPAGELSLWGEMLFPALAHPTRLDQVYVGAGLRVRPEWPLVDTADLAFARPLGLSFEAGFSTAAGRFGLALGAEAVAFSPSLDGVRPALAFELDLGLRADTRDDLSWIVELVPSASVAGYGGDARWALGLALGLSYERPTPRALPCVPSTGPARTSPDVTRCPRDRPSAYLRLSP
ncbi:MAG: hypothetical protein U0324_42205 [Polyangiales bacterium]